MRQITDLEGRGSTPLVRASSQGEARARRVPALEAGGRWAEHRTLTNSLSWLEWRGARLLNGFTRVRILPRAPNWRVNPPGRGRRLLNGRCGNACESCSQLSANLARFRFCGFGSLADRAPSKRCQGGSIPPVRTNCSVRLVARIALFQSAGEGSKPSRSTSHGRFVQWQDASL
jgi:hypothetical protein